LSCWLTIQSVVPITIKPTARIAGPTTPRSSGCSRPAISLWVTVGRRFGFQRQKRIRTILSSCSLKNFRVGRGFRSTRISSACWRDQPVLSTPRRRPCRGPPGGPSDVSSPRQKHWFDPTVAVAKEIDVRGSFASAGFVVVPALGRMSITVKPLPGQ